MLRAMKRIKDIRRKFTGKNTKLCLQVKTLNLIFQQNVSSKLTGGTNQKTLRQNVHTFVH